MAKKKRAVLNSKVAAPKVDNPLFVGLDQSVSGTGITLRDGAGEIIGEHMLTPISVTKPIDGVQRLIQLFADFRSYVLDHAEGRVPCVVKEDFAFSQANQMALLGGLGWHFRIMLSRTGWHFATCPTGTLKKVATDRGNANKSAVILACYKRWGFETDNDNLADACVLSWVSFVLYGKPMPGKMVLQRDLQATQKVAVYR